MQTRRAADAVREVLAAGELRAGLALGLRVGILRAEDGSETVEAVRAVRALDDLAELAGAGILGVVVRDVANGAEDALFLAAAGPGAVALRGLGVLGRGA